ncbi:hypothetical protein THRCLA_01876 [Thraustotheca clavata]|uniref:Transmembrane protein n=1 Tax=Thraustotheca clavata TaxID=74557 RepID=A0A1W0A714_9STRA|nr:hypothetical protein THRCLA_01876 [Thraustotheca clavata]
MTSKMLKKYKKEHLFTKVDPTLTVFFVIIFPALVMRLFAKVILCSSIELQSQYHEESVRTIVFVNGMTSLPIFYGFLVRFACKTQLIIPIYRNATFSSWHTSQHSEIFTSFSDYQQVGGSIRDLTTIHPRYKQCPTINFCGGECFILYYRDGVLENRIRLSLLSILDRHLNDSQIINTKSESGKVLSKVSKSKLK